MEYEIVVNTPPHQELLAKGQMKTMVQLQSLYSCDSQKYTTYLLPVTLQTTWFLRHCLCIHRCHNNYTISNIHVFLLFCTCFSTILQQEFIPFFLCAAICIFLNRRSDLERSLNRMLVQTWFTSRYKQRFLGILLLI